MTKTTALPKSRAKTAYGLLTEIRRLILDEPKRYNQCDWLQRRNGGNNIEDEYFPACGTVGCVAGWVTALKAPRAKTHQVSSKAARILGLTSLQAYALFSESAADFEPQTPAHARSGADHIARFQREHRTQLKAKRV